MYCEIKTQQTSTNALRPRQDGRYFEDDVLTYFLLSENMWISLKIPLNFVPRGPINNILALVQIMAWRRPGDDKPLSEPMMVRLPTHICVYRPQRFNHDYNMTFLFYHTNVDILHFKTGNMGFEVRIALRATPIVLSHSGFNDGNCGFPIPVVRKELMIPRLRSLISGCLNAVKSFPPQSNMLQYIWEFGKIMLLILTSIDHQLTAVEINIIFC